MASRTLLFGKPPFRFLADQLAQDTDFLEDAHLIIGLDEDAYLRLATQLAMADTFLSLPELGEIANEALGEEAERVASIIHRFGGIVHDADMDAADAMNTLARAIERRSESLDPQDRRTLIDRLRRLVVEPIGIAKQYKAQQLVEAIGAELDDFRIICDIRPIFDRNRERIDGAIPISTMRLEYTTPDGEPAVTEFRLTEQQLTDLGDMISDANLKLQMTKALLHSYDLPVPKTKSTVSEGES